MTYRPSLLRVADGQVDSLHGVVSYRPSLSRVADGQVDSLHGVVSLSGVVCSLLASRLVISTEGLADFHSSRCPVLKSGGS